MYLSEKGKLFYGFGTVKAHLHVFYMKMNFSLVAMGKDDSGASLWHKSWVTDLSLPPQHACARLPSGAMDSDTSVGRGASQSWLHVGKVRKL